MIFSWFATISLFIAALSGIVILALGDWRNQHLKHSALLLSTTVSVANFFMLLGDRGFIYCTATSIMCANWWIYYLAGNVAIVLFHISVAKDVIIYKKKNELWERRDERWKRSI
jgi:hypothetical protein